MNYTGYPSIDRRNEDNVSFLAKHPFIPNMSIYDLLRLINLNNGKGYAIDCDNLRMTYGELFDNVKILSKAFREMGVKKGDIVVVSSPNIAQAIETYLACNRIGAICSMLGASPTLPEVIHDLNWFESPLLINYGANNVYNDEILKQTKVNNIISIDEKEVDRKDFNLLAKDLIGYDKRVNFYDLKLVSDCYRGKVKEHCNGKDTAQISFTSGTTGKPKAIVLSNENIIANALYCKNSTGVKINRDEKCLVVVTFKVPYGLDTSAILSMLCGKEIILAPNLSAATIHNYLAKRPNFIFGTVNFYDMLMASPMVDKMDLSDINIAMSGGLYLSSQKNALITDYFRRHNSNAKVCNGLGFSEVGGAGTNALVDVDPETVGRPLVGANMMVIDPETGKELKYGEEGIICVSGKRVFSHYYKNEEETKKAKFIDDKGVTWFKSDATGILTETGYLKTAGRNQDFFGRMDESGEWVKVYCNHVADVLKSLPCIDDAVVVATDNPDEYGDTGAALVVINDEFKNDPDIINKIKLLLTKPVEDRVTGEVMQLRKVDLPKIITPIDKMPYMETGKVNYDTVKQLVKKR